MNIRLAFHVKVSKFIRNFIMADTALFGGWGFIDPVFSVFIVREIVGASVVTVGFTVALYWIVKSLVQIPIGIILDRIKGEKDDFYVLIAAMIVIGIAAFLFMFATRVWHVYLIQAFKAVGFAMYVATWPPLFSRHIDRDHYSLDWSLDSTSVGLAMGLAGFGSGIVATWWGYHAVFAVAGIFSFISAAILFFAADIVLPPDHRRTQRFLRDHAPVNINQ